MLPNDIILEIVTNLPGVIPKATWGETSLFYNPGNVLPNGVYFCTLKTHDGQNDKASNLNREGVFRVAIGLAPEAYSRLFGHKPKRPEKGGIVKTDHAFTKINELMPHPIYAWMGWAQVLCPSRETFLEIFPLIKEAHQLALVKFRKKAINQTSSG
jgi:hypothetical protein